MSPAVLTETIWALAEEKPAVIPDRVVVVTTAGGRRSIQAELFGPARVWEALCSALKQGHDLTGKLRFGTTGEDIRVFTRADARGRSIELDDIRTPEDNEAAADFLLDKLREFTENEDVSLICSLAGGRKTMGALLYACLSLIGREHYRLTHVLVNEPFDDPRLRPRFYFPTNPATLHHSTTPSLRASSASARIQLADVPFVPLRNLFPRELGRMPGRFMNLVEQYRETIQKLAKPPHVELRSDEPVVVVDNRPVRLPATAFALLSFLVERARRNESAFLSFKEAIDPFQAFVAGWAKGHYDFRRDAQEKLSQVDASTFRKLGNMIGTALRKAGIAPAVIQHLRPHRGRFGIRVASPK